MNPFLMVARGEHHDDEVWYPELFHVRPSIDPDSFFEGFRCGVSSIWGDFSETFGCSALDRLYGDLHNTTLVQWRPRDEGAWIHCNGLLMCKTLMDGFARGEGHHAIDMKVLE